MSEEFEQDRRRYELVDKYHVMNPLLEDLIKGHQLRDGMRVLIADPRFRGDLREPDYFYSSESFRDGVLRWNRWMTVTDLDTSFIEVGLVSFIGLYDDGTKRDFILSVLHGWFVKFPGVSDELLESALQRLRETEAEVLTPEKVEPKDVPTDVADFIEGVKKNDTEYNPE